jgi:hypothetical protein
MHTKVYHCNLLVPSITLIKPIDKRLSLLFYELTDIKRGQ